MLLAIDTSDGHECRRRRPRPRRFAERAGADDPLPRRGHRRVDPRRARRCRRRAVAELSGVAAGMGPGPFTGLRVGIAARARVRARASATRSCRCQPRRRRLRTALRAGGAGRLRSCTDARRREFAGSATTTALDDDGLPLRIGGPGLARADALTRSPTPGYRRSTRDSVSAGALGMLAELAFAAGRAFAGDDAALPARARRDALRPGRSG